MSNRSRGTEGDGPHQGRPHARLLPALCLPHARPARPLGARLAHRRWSSPSSLAQLPTRVCFVLCLRRFVSAWRRRSVSAWRRRFVSAWRRRWCLPRARPASASCSPGVRSVSALCRLLPASCTPRICLLLAARRSPRVAPLPSRVRLVFAPLCPASVSCRRRARPASVLCRPCVRPAPPGVRLAPPPCLRRATWCPPRAASAGLASVFVRLGPASCTPRATRCPLDAHPWAASCLPVPPGVRVALARCSRRAAWCSPRARLGAGAGGGAVRGGGGPVRGRRTAT